MTRSAMPAIGALWVMTTTVVPSFALTRADRLEHEAAGLDSRALRSARRRAAPPAAWRSRGRSRRAAARHPKLRRKVIQAVARDRPARSASSGGIGLLGDLGDERDVLARGEAGDQVVELKHEADVLAAVARERRLRRPLTGRGRARTDAPARRSVEAAEDVQQRRLAAARRPEQDDELALVDFQVD